MDTINKDFTRKTIHLDGNTFTNCSFFRCTFVYEASGPWAFLNCDVQLPTYVFSGAALLTLDFLSRLYTSGGGAIVEATFEKTRRGSIDTERDLILGDISPGIVQ